MRAAYVGVTFAALAFSCNRRGPMAGQDAPRTPNARHSTVCIPRRAWESHQNGPPAERNADGPLACRSPPAVHRRRREVHEQIINATAARTVPLTLAAEGPALPRGGDPQRPGAGKNCGDDQPERKTARIWLRRRAHRLGVPLTTARRQEWGARCRRAVPVEVHQMPGTS
jgi:hypothetical protein